MSLRRLWTLVVREVRATLRDPFTMIALVAVPLSALLAFGFVLDTNVRGLDLGVHDASRSAASRRLLADLTATGAFVARPYPDRSALDAALVSGEIAVGLVLPPDFERGASRGAGSPRPEVQVLYDGAEAVLAGNSEAFLSALVAASGARLVLRPLGASSARTGQGISVVTKALYNPKLEGKPFMVAGTFGFVLSFLTVLITVVTIVNERAAGTFDQLQLTPATNLEILLGKLLPLGAVFALDVVLMVLVAGFVLGVWPAGNALVFVAISSAYVLTSLALGLLISATSKTGMEAVQKSVILSIPLVQLSGFSFAIASMPTPVRWLAELLPATHYIRVSRAIYIRGEGFFDLLPELGLLFLLGAVPVVGALRSLGRRA